MYPQFYLTMLVLLLLYGNVTALSSPLNRINSNHPYSQKIASNPFAIIINTVDAPIGRPRVSESDAKSLPVEFDARTRWPQCSEVISHISSQGSCGSCWAVVTTDVISDRLCIASNGAIQTRISPYHLMECCGLGACADGVSDFSGCDGGDPWGAWRYFTHHGLATASCKPSPAWLSHYGLNPLPKSSNCSTKCQNPKLDYRSQLYRGSEYYRLPADEATIRKEILEHGPVVAAFISRDMEEYNTWVDEDSVYECAKSLNEDDLADHGVRLIGWGVTRDGRPYWLAANSFGTKWGLNGLFKIARGNNTCRIEEQITAGIPLV